MEDLINWLLEENRPYWRITDKNGKVVAKYQGDDENEAIEKLKTSYSDLLAGRYRITYQHDASSAKGAINKDFLVKMTKMAALETPNFAAGGGNMELGIQIGRLSAQLDGVKTQLEELKPLIPFLQRLKDLDIDKLYPILKTMVEVDKQLIESFKQLTDDDDENDDDALGLIAKAGERVNQVKELFDSFKK